MGAASLSCPEDSPSQSLSTPSSTVFLESYAETFSNREPICSWAPGHPTATFSRQFTSVVFCHSLHLKEK